VPKKIFRHPAEKITAAFLNGKGDSRKLGFPSFQEASPFVSS
jgi:hypothetical protein